MRLLLTNDDGVSALGIAALVKELKDFDLTIVAPASEMSAVSHGLTIRQPLICHERTIFDHDATAVFGTPADCVKLALDQLMTPLPDCVVSGINQGPNTGINVFYSGTVAAAVEATLMGVPAIAVSLASFTSHEFETAAVVARYCIDLIRNTPLPPGILLNVNVPSVPYDEIQGFRQTIQGMGRYKDTFVKRLDPRGRPYYWLTGNRVDTPMSLIDDDQALAENYISITPLQATFNVYDSFSLELPVNQPGLTRITRS